MKLRRHVVISVLVPLVIVISTIVSPVAATTYKKMSTVHTLVESGFSTRVTLSGNRYDYAVAWDTTGAVHAGLCPRDELESRHGIPFSKEFDYSAPGGWENPAVPSILLLENGTICMLLKMRPTPSEEKPFLVFVKSSNNGTSWSAPVVVTPALIINGTSRDSLRNPWLLQLNSTHLIAMWADARHASVTNGLYSIMCSLSGNNGTDWIPPFALFENCTNHFTAIKTRTGQVLTSMVFEKAEYRPGKTVTPYNIYYVEVPTNGSALDCTEPQRLYPDSTSIPCYMEQFDNGDFLLTVTENLVLAYKTSSDYSGLYRISDTLSYAFLGLYMVGPSTALGFFFADGKCKFVYLDHFVESNDGGLTNEQILLIVIAVVIGVQVGLCAVHKIKKRRALRGKGTPEPDTGLNVSPRQEPPEEGSTNAKIEPPTSTGSDAKQEQAEKDKQETMTNDRKVHEKNTAVKQDS